VQVIQIEAADGSFFVRRGEAITRLLAIGGAPLPLHPDWTPVRLLTGATGTAVMELRHIGGASSLWFLDEELRFAKNSFAELPSEAQNALLAVVPGFPSIRWDDFSVPNPLAGLEVAGVRLFNDRSTEELASLAEFWRANEYLVVPNALTPGAMELLREEITFNELNNMDDYRQFYRVHNDKSCFQFIQKIFAASLGFYEAILGSRLLQTNAFAMKYIKNSNLIPHYDNLHTPISSTVCYHFTPEGADNPLFLDRAKFFNPYTARVTVDDKAGIPETNIVRIDLSPGDIAVFRGRTHLHWRQAIENEMDYRAILMHFTDSEYKNALQKGRHTPNVTQDLIDLNNYTEFRENYSMYFERNGQDWI